MERDAPAIDPLSDPLFDAVASVADQVPERDDPDCANTTRAEKVEAVTRLRPVPIHVPLTFVVAWVGAIEELLPPHAVAHSAQRSTTVSRRRMVASLTGE